MARSCVQVGVLLFVLQHLLPKCVNAYVPCGLWPWRNRRLHLLYDWTSATAGLQHLPEPLQSPKHGRDEYFSRRSLRCRYSIDSVVDRRAVILSPSVGVAAAAPFVVCAPQTSSAAVEPTSSVLDLVTGQADVPQLENGVLESRVLENVMSPPPYGMEGQDIYYPEWIAGSWMVKSVTTDVQAPCGPMLFRGNATFVSARKEIGSVLNYESRFILDGNGRVVADREYNVKSIAKQAMGTNSVVDVSLSTPNKFSCLLSPKGSPSLLRVDLVVLNRRQEDVDGNNFHCSEVVREIVSPVGESNSPSRPQSPLLKEIETTSLYRLVGPSEVRCLQRSATFLLPSQQDPKAMKMWEMSRGRPTDVRFYDVVYRKR